MEARSRWAAPSRLQLLPNMASRIVKPIGPAVGARIFSDPCTASGGPAAVAFFRKGRGEFPVWLSGASEDAFARFTVYICLQRSQL